MPGSDTPVVSSSAVAKSTSKRVSSKSRPKPKKRRADAKPIKAFFAGMLSKDVTLPAAIFDLLDNSLDGARRMRGQKRLTGLWVKITARPKGFVIEDNCGGISINVAEHYAFRFGRTDAASKVLDFSHSTGQFGVGMKRAFFKLGTGFKVDSRSSDGHFRMNEDVSDWFTPTDSAMDTWGFGIEVVSETPIPTKDRGTKLVVAPLHDTVADDFGYAEFLGELQSELAERYVVPLEEGLEIHFNGHPVRPKAPKIIVSPKLAPTVRIIGMDAEGNDVEEGESPVVSLRILCGVAKIEAPAAGWSVALNSRMVLLADKTPVVGWDTQNGTRVPAFHNQYGKLRGLALLDADETRALPWNTTKSKLDVDQAVYRRARREMVLAMEPVVRFLNRVKVERDNARKLDLDPDSQPLNRLFEKPKRASAIKHLLRGDCHEFHLPAQPKPPRTAKTTTSVQYEVDRIKMNRAKRALDVGSNAQVGEETFDFWWRSQFD